MRGATLTQIKIILNLPRDFKCVRLTLLSTVPLVNGSQNHPTLFSDITLSVFYSS
jgi:hypothetical protein